MTTKSTISKLHERNDNALATRFIDEHGQQLRYVSSWKKWLGWTGQKWSLELGDDRVMKLARQFSKKLWTEAAGAMKSTDLSDQQKKEIVNFASAANDARRIENMVKLARHDDRVSIVHRQLDSDNRLLNLLNGTFDLRSGIFREHQQEDLITQVANVKYDPNAKCPNWLETLGYIFNSDAELIRYVQTAVGYCLSGITDEHILPIGYGEGRNGKSTFWNAIADILGDYAALVSQDLLMPNSEQHPTEVADLFGKRFVAVSEPEQGRKLAESKVKDMTGDRRLKARRMREDFWEFTPTHTFWLSTNHKPKITGTDTGIWRRIKLIPFTVDLSTVLKVDKSYPEKLISEYSGILNWAIAGWKNYQNEGLVDPRAVIEATEEYRSSEDIVGQFITENYVLNPNFQVAAIEVYETFKQAGGSMSQKEFGEEMGRRFEKERTNLGGKKVTIYRGIGTI